ncbi:basement membrane-specific heparan sulfate proteoglycan core protein-like [Hemitrygon akajei]|uniref:basement membrane-specific heparan sulfate proteoglycan core protein-like n=1 Tax=Hemitrygon akajei TaxID=2704970 RepID=UPI003BFA06FA
MSVFFQLQFLLVLAPFAACQLQKIPVSNPVISAKIDYKFEEIVVTTISCLSTEGTLPIHYTLYKNQDMLKTLRAEVRRTAEFVVQLSNSELQETLKCKAENGFEPKYSRGLVIDWSVKLTSYPDPPILGQQLTLNCTVTYETKAWYKWYFVYPSENKTEDTEQNQILIEAAKSGIYYCSMHDQISNKIEVPVQDWSVKLISYPDPPIPGQQLTLNCTVTYKTKEEYSWYFVYPFENKTEVTQRNQIIMEAAKSGIYYCSMNDQISNKIEVPVQDFSLQPVVMGVSIAVILVLVLILGLICYCSVNKAHRFNTT